MPAKKGWVTPFFLRERKWNEERSVGGKNIPEKTGQKSRKRFPKIASASRLISLLIFFARASFLAVFPHIFAQRKIDWPWSDFLGQDGAKITNVLVLEHVCNCWVSGWRQIWIELYLIRDERICNTWHCWPFHSCQFATKKVLNFAGPRSVSECAKSEITLAQKKMHFLAKYEMQDQQFWAKNIDILSRLVFAEMRAKLCIFYYATPWFAAR